MIRICDDDGRELPVGESGTIYFSDGRSSADHKDTAKTAASRNQLYPHWSMMGDVGRIAEDGYMFLSDRENFMILFGGVNTYLQEVENLLITHLAVADVAAFGILNGDFGEEVKAVVQPTNPETPGDALAGALITWCRTQLADIKSPRSIDLDPALPRAETGKLFKKEVCARYWPAA